MGKIKPDKCHDHVLSVTAYQHLVQVLGVGAAFRKTMHATQEVKHAVLVLSMRVPAWTGAPSSSQGSEAQQAAAGTRIVRCALSAIAALGMRAGNGVLNQNMFAASLHKAHAWPTHLHPPE